MNKKIAAVLLTILFVLTLAPTAFAADDTTAPSLTDVVLNSTTFNKEDTLTITIKTTEKESGLDPTKCYVHYVANDPNTPGCSIDDFIIRLDTVNPNDVGEITGSIKLNEKVGGTYWLECVSLMDKKGNGAFYCKFENTVPDAGFTLVSDYVRPIPPQPYKTNVTGFSCSSYTARPGDTVNYSITVSEPAGITYAAMHLRDLNPRWNRKDYDIPLTLTPGSEYTFTASFTVPADMYEEIYYPEFVFQNGLGELAWLYNGLDSKFGDIRLHVINPSVQPISDYPTLLSYSLSSHRLALGQTLTVTASIDTKFTGVSYISAEVRKVVPWGINPITAGTVHMSNKGGGVFSGTFDIPFDVKPGEYTLNCFYMWDNDYNGYGLRIPDSMFTYDNYGDAYLSDGYLSIINPLSVSGTDNRTLLLGEAFDPMQGVSATNVYTGDVTDKITLVGGNIDTNVPGVYLIKYIVDDTVTTGGTDNPVKYTDYRWIGVSELEPQAPAENGEMPLAISNDAMAIGASSSEVSIKKDGAAIPYSSAVTEPGEYTLTATAGSTAGSATLGSSSNSGTTVTAVIDRSGPETSISWRKEASTGVFSVALKARDMAGVAEIKYLAGEQNLAAFKDGGTVYNGIFTIPGYGKYTVYSRDGLGNESVRTVDINKAFSDSAYLWDAKISAGKISPLFIKTRYTYKINLAEDEGKITLTPVKESDAAVMSINGKIQDSITMDIGNNQTKTVKVKVSFSGKSKAYSFVIKREKSTSYQLKSLTANANGVNIPFNEAFDENRLHYTLNLDQNTKSVKITTEMLSPAARASFKAKTFTLQNGETKHVKISLRSQTGFTTSCYVDITRAASTDNRLISLKTSSGSFILSPAFKPDTRIYAITMPANKNSFTLNAKSGGYKSYVTIDDVKCTSKKITLASGQSVTVHIVVTSQSGGTKEYLITVNKP